MSENTRRYLDTAIVTLGFQRSFDDWTCDHIVVMQSRLGGYTVSRESAGFINRLSSHRSLVDAIEAAVAHLPANR